MLNIGDDGCMGEKRALNIEDDGCMELEAGAKHRR